MTQHWDSQQLKLFGINAAIAVITVCVLACACMLCVAREISDKRVFAMGVSVDGVDLSGMTYGEAENVLSGVCESNIDSITVALSVGGNSYVFGAKSLGVASNVTDVLEKAFSIGKTAGNSAYSISPDAARLQSGYKLDVATLTALLNDLAAKVNINAAEPSVIVDKTTRRFTFIEGSYGCVIDINANVAMLTDRFRKGDFAKCSLIMTETKPLHVIDDLRANTMLVSAYATETTNNFNRNTNIALMCEYLNGYAIAPGAVLSINELVGQRTAEKGFMPAPAIMDGKRLENDLGGGICQVSGTLYNAALLANMCIVERTAHSWPSDYVPIGLDSTLDWNSQKDLKLKNVTEYPTYVFAWLDSASMSGRNTLHIELYGEPLPDGVSITIRREITETIQPPAASKTYTASLPRGTVNVAIKERIGYKTHVWRDFYYNGVLIDSEPMSSSYYRAVQGELLVGTGGASGTSQPRQSEKPAPTPAPTYIVVPLESMKPITP